MRGVVKGLCYTSNHPKRRAPREMPFYAPTSRDLFGRWEADLRERSREGLLPDYIFPRMKVPRKGTIASPGVQFLDGPANSASAGC